MILALKKACLNWSFLKVWWVIETNFFIFNVSEFYPIHCTKIYLLSCLWPLTSNYLKWHFMIKNLIKNKYTDLCPHCSRLVLQMWQCYNPPLPIQVNTWDLLWHMCWYEGYIRLIYILCLQTLLHSNSQCRVRIPETSATTV